MKSNVEKISGLERKVKVEIPLDIVNSTFSRVYREVQKDAEIKGFRKGKAPIETIRSMYADVVRKDVVKELLQKGYAQAVEEHSLEPISFPKFDFEKVEENEIFTFTALFEIHPEVSLKKYEGLEVEKEKLAVEDKLVDEVLENIRKSRSSSEPLLILRPAQVGDVAVVDFVGSVDGKPLDNGKAENHHLELGTRSFIEGFEDGIIGMNVGDHRTLNLKFPDQYHAKELENKPVSFQVTLKELRKKSIPELSDDLVKELKGKEQTVSELRETIRQDLQVSEEKRVNEELRNRLLKVLVKTNPVDVPPTMLAEQKKLLINDLHDRMHRQGQTHEEFDEYVKKWEVDIESAAKEIVQSGFLIEQIAEKHSLRCTEEDIAQKYEEYVQQSGLPIERIKEYFGSREQSGRLNYQITEDKVVRFLLEKAHIKEVEREQIKNKLN